MKPLRGGFVKFGTKQHVCARLTLRECHANEALVSASRRVCLMVIFSRLFLDVSKLVGIFDLTVLGTFARQYKMKKMLFHFVLFSLIRTFAPTNNEFTELRWQWIIMK